MTHFTNLVILLYLWITQLNGKAIIGPCVGPDCFHGQMMHGDKEEGVDHQAEDTYFRLKEDLAAGQEAIKPDTPEDLGAGQLDVDIGPQIKEDEGAKKPIGLQPQDIESLITDGAEHNQGEIKEIPETGKKQGPGGAEYWHGVINHGDEEPGKDHHHDRKRKPVKYDFDIKDIKAIEGIDNLLSQVDLEAILNENKQEYVQHMEQQKMEEDEPESLWEQIDKVRQRYLSFGSADDNDVDDETKRAQRLDPELAEWETENTEENKKDDEDDILRGLEMLGNTAPKNKIHVKKIRKDL